MNSKKIVQFDYIKIKTFLIVETPKAKLKATIIWDKNLLHVNNQALISRIFQEFLQIIKKKDDVIDKWVLEGNREKSEENRQ